MEKGLVEPSNDPAHHRWTTEDSPQPDRIVIPAAQLGAGPRTLNLQVVGHNGFIGNSLYTLLVTATGSATALSDGLAIRDTVQGGKYNFYAFNTTSATKPLSIVLTPLSGDPDLFVSTETHHPDQNDHTWSAQSPRFTTAASAAIAALRRRPKLKRASSMAR